MFYFMFQFAPIFSGNQEYNNCSIQNDTVIIDLNILLSLINIFLVVNAQ